MSVRVHLSVHVLDLRGCVGGGIRDGVGARDSFLFCLQQNVAEDP